MFLSVSDITAAQCPGSFVVDVLRFRVYIRLGKAQPITTAVPPPESKFSKGPTWPLERKYKFLFCSLGGLPSLEHERLQPRGRWRDDDKCHIERAAGYWCGSCGSSCVGADYPWTLNWLTSSKGYLVQERTYGQLFSISRP